MNSSTDTAINNRLDELEQEWEDTTLASSLKKMPESQSEFTTVSLKPISVGRSNAVESPVWPCSSKYLKRWLVSNAEPNPANWRIVQALAR